MVFERKARLGGRGFKLRINYQRTNCPYKRCCRFFRPVFQAIIFDLNFFPPHQGRVYSCIFAEILEYTPRVFDDPTAGPHSTFLFYFIIIFSHLLVSSASSTCGIFPHNVNSRTNCMFLDAFRPSHFHELTNLKILLQRGCDHFVGQALKLCNMRRYFKFFANFLVMQQASFCNFGVANILPKNSCEYFSASAIFLDCTRERIKKLHTHGIYSSEAHVNYIN